MDVMDFIYIGFLFLFYASMKASGRKNKKFGRDYD